MWHQYNTCQNPSLLDLAYLEKDNDSEYSDKNVKTVQDIVLETQMGTIVYYLDDVEETVKNNSRHRVPLSYEYRCSKDIQLKKNW